MNLTAVERKPRRFGVDGWFYPGRKWFEFVIGGQVISFSVPTWQLRRALAALDREDASKPEAGE